MRRRRSKPSRLIFLIIALIAFALSRMGNRYTPTNKQPESTGEFTGKCVGISDGDTIRVMHKGYEERIRLYGVDSPEKKQAYGTVARTFTSKMVFGKTVRVEVRGKDRYGRTIGWVTTENEQVLNEELVKAGLAWWYRSYAPNDQHLASLEDTARTEKRGLWSAKNPIPPWQFRKRARRTTLQ